MQRGEKNRGIKEQQTRRTQQEKKRKETKYGRFSKTGSKPRSNSYRPNPGRVFRLFSLDTQDIYLLFFAKATPLFRSPRFFTVWPPTDPASPRLPPPGVSGSRPVSFRSAPAKAGQYIILAVSLFLRTKASSKLEKPRHARNGRNPGPVLAVLSASVREKSRLKLACVRSFEELCRIFDPIHDFPLSRSRPFINQIHVY